MLSIAVSIISHVIAVTLLQQAERVFRSIRGTKMRWFVGLLTLLVACSREAPVEVCQYWLVAAITVDVADAATGSVLTAHAAGVVRDGAYSDSLRLCDFFSKGSQCAAFERPGTYEVEVTSEGYQAWSTRGVVVTNGSCHVNTVALKAKLVRAQ